MANDKIYQLKISLDDITPSIWRRIQVPGDISLFELHFILQIAMGWTNSHLHEFRIRGERYGTLYDDEFVGENYNEDHKFKLEEVLPPGGSVLAIAMISATAGIILLRWKKSSHLQRH